MKRLTELADETQQTIQLAYYPPHHSKYNPIERVWGVLENYWNGSLLDTLATVVEVKAKFSAYLEASKEGPVVVTKNGNL